jgi:hypothetical protein
MATNHSPILTGSRLFGTKLKKHKISVPSIWESWVEPRMLKRSSLNIIFDSILGGTFFIN